MDDGEPLESASAKQSPEKAAIQERSHNKIAGGRAATQDQTSNPDARGSAGNGMLGHTTK